MAEFTTVARPYAEAAFRLATENREVERWSDMLEVLELAVGEDVVASRLGDPSMGDEALESVILGALGERLNGHGRNFVQVLIQNNRLGPVPHIRTQYEALRREQEGVLEARIVSAMPVEDAQVQPLVAALERKYGRKVNARIEVDAELIGGARIEIGDKVIDATVRARLDELAAALAH